MIVVTDDWAEIVPVESGEIATVEHFLLRVLDQVLRPLRKKNSAKRVRGRKRK
ncbi:hypothetical protein [Limoniibacter endophyticus]|uniref:hypothetical protein n=1 Tax=Limoniibacter endophyticus TaxID=1565040 RepID=UPI00167758D4|nr:hypothetical protein [Limoniibacter endophyticus]